MTAVRLVPTRCAVCGTGGDATERYAANFEPEALNPVVFSARRIPDGIHYRLVTCDRCGLVRSDPIAEPQVLERLYRESTFDETEVPNVRRTYGRYLAELDRYGARKERLIEIGSGTGFVLEEALAQGYRSVIGVEPSAQAASQAARRPGVEVISDVMRPGLIPPRTVDVVCMFQTLDHLPDPGAVLDECRAVLRPGGLILALNHDVAAWSARLLGRRSPIVDIEHTYLFDARTMCRLFEARGYEVLAVDPAENLVSIRYLARLLPAPASVRRFEQHWLGSSAFGRWSLWLRLGNVRLVARRPAP